MEKVSCTFPCFEAVEFLCFLVQPFSPFERRARQTFARELNYFARLSKKKKNKTKENQIIQMQLVVDVIWDFFILTEDNVMTR